MNNVSVVWFEGNFKEYDADLRRRKGADADTQRGLLRLSPSPDYGRRPRCEIIRHLVVSPFVAMWGANALLLAPALTVVWRRRTRLA